MWRFRKQTVLALQVFMFVIVPALNLLGIADNTHLNKLARHLCFAIVALGIDLLWGYTGLLSLCQVFFFCLGGYAMAMHLSLPQGGRDVRPEYNGHPQDSLKDRERRVEIDALEHNSGIQSRAARDLGITLRQMGYRVKKFGLEELVKPRKSAG